MPVTTPPPFIEKPRQYGDTITISFPITAAGRADVRPGFFVAVHTIADCMVITRVTDTTPDAIEAQMRHAVNRLIADWKKENG
jgi:hypothetical protein